MFAKANAQSNETNEEATSDDGFYRNDDTPPTPPEANSGERESIYKDSDSGVVICHGDRDDTDYIVVYPDGTVKNTNAVGPLDSKQIKELFEVHAAKVY